MFAIVRAVGDTVVIRLQFAGGCVCATFRPAPPHSIPRALACGTAQSASRMTGRADQAHKYVDIETYSFRRARFDTHLAGRDTYAGRLGVLGAAW